MKKLVVFLLSITFFYFNSAAQTSKPIRKQSIGFSFLMNDFATAQRIRATSLSSVLREKTFARSEDFAYGFAVSYIKGLTPHVDLAATLSSSFSTEANFPGREDAGENTLLELDASAHFKMFPETFTVNPYLIAGVGVSKFTNVYGAILPLGGGIKINVAGEMEIHTQLQYRVPITPDANSHHFQFSFGISGIL